MYWVDVIWTHFHAKLWIILNSNIVWIYFFIYWNVQVLVAWHANDSIKEEKKSTKKIIGGALAQPATPLRGPWWTSGFVVKVMVLITG